MNHSEFLLKVMMRLSQKRVGFRPLSLICACFISYSVSVQANVEAFGIELPNTSASYAVPTGKVLLVEHVYFEGTTSQTGFLNCRFPGFSGALSVKNTGGTLHSFSKALALPAATVVTFSGQVSAARAVGKLIDSTDLYAAAVPANIDQAQLLPGALSIVVKADSKAPTTVQTEYSNDLTIWQKAAPSSRQQLNPGSQRVTLPTAGSVGFVRARVTRTENN
jgi:hypothetical protein